MSKLLPDSQATSYIHGVITIIIRAVDELFEHAGLTITVSVTQLKIIACILKWVMIGTCNVRDVLLVM